MHHGNYRKCGLVIFQNMGQCFILLLCVGLINYSFDFLTNLYLMPHTFSWYIVNILYYHSSITPTTVISTQTNLKPPYTQSRDLRHPIYINLVPTSAQNKVLVLHLSKYDFFDASLMPVYDIHTSSVNSNS